MFSTKRLVFNALTFIPGATTLPVVKHKLQKRSLGTGGTLRARYCYAVWLRHLVHAYKNGLNCDPKRVAELGPGDSIGIGLAAVLTGAQQYYAFDVVEHANINRNLQVLDELCELFASRAPVPGPEEFPAVKPGIDSYDFPDHILSDARLDACLDAARIERIRHGVKNVSSPGSMVQYRAPWDRDATVEANSIDMVFSQAVLEHVDDLHRVYDYMHRWLHSDGFVSHLIDFKCHDSAREWNGHWAHSETMWHLVRGKDVWLINREPHSTHLRLLREYGFEVIEDTVFEMASNLKRDQLASRFKHLTDADLRTTEAFIQAKKVAMH